MKSGDLVRHKPGTIDESVTGGLPGLVISAFVRRVSMGVECYEIEVLFPSGLWRHPHFPASMLEVVDETR